MSPRTPKDSGEGRVSRKIDADSEFSLTMERRNPNVLASTASESPRKTRHESHLSTGRHAVDACSSSFSRLSRSALTVSWVPGATSAPSNACRPADNWPSNTQRSARLARCSTPDLARRHFLRRKMGCLDINSAPFDEITPLAAVEQTLSPTTMSWGPVLPGEVATGKSEAVARTTSTLQSTSTRHLFHGHR